MHELRTLWERTLGTPPPDEQFAIWIELHHPDIVRRAILKTAIKNQQMNRTMSSDHRFRFASRVMMTLTEQAASNAANKRLRQAVESRPQVLVTSHAKETPDYTVTGQCTTCGAGYTLGEPDGPDGPDYTVPTCFGCGAKQEKVR